MSVNQGVHPKVEALFRYPYRNRRASGTLSRLSSKTGVIIEGHILRSMRDQGFDLDPVRDNKSVYDPELLFGQLARYDESLAWLPSENTYQRAFELTLRAFGSGGSKLEPLSDVADIISALKLEKASGAPEFTSKRESLERDLQRAGRIALDQKAPDPCVAFHRVQHGSEGPKTRLVWGFPLSMTILESRFARPLIDWYKRNRTPMAFGCHRHEVSARLMPISNSGIRYGLDFSGFDSTIHPRLLDMAFQVLRTFYPELDEDDDRVWRKLTWYFIHTPILMPDGNIYQKHRGVPSGSYFTQIVDSIVNYFAIQYAMIELSGKAIHDDKLMVLGDDSIFGIDVYLDLKAFDRVFGTLGLKLGVKKSQVSKFPDTYNFLGHSWFKGVVDRPAIEVAQRMAFPERISAIEDPRVRITTRMLAYVADSASGYKIYQRWSRYKGLWLYGIFNRDADMTEPVTGWQEFVSEDARHRGYPKDASDLAYRGILS